MRINSITSYRSSYNNSRQTPVNNNRKVSFGFGEDYGMDPSENAFPNASKPSTLKSLKYLAELACAAGSELFGSDNERLRQIERLGWELEERERREELARREQLNKTDDSDDDDY